MPEKNLESQRETSFLYKIFALIRRIMEGPLLKLTEKDRARTEYYGRMIQKLRDLEEDLVTYKPEDD